MLGKPPKTIMCHAITWRKEAKRKAMEHPADTTKETRMGYTRKKLEKMATKRHDGIPGSIAYAPSKQTASKLVFKVSLKVG